MKIIVLFLIISSILFSEVKSKYEVNFYPPNGNGYSIFYTDKIEYLIIDGMGIYGAYRIMDKRNKKIVILPINCTLILEK